jgi:putative ABC transport system permease protein
MHTLIQDIRYAARTLRRNAGFTTVAVVALALGIGANTAVFTVVNGVLLRPLPFPAPERLVALSALTEGLPFAMGPALPDRLYLEFRNQDRYLEKLAAFSSNQVNMTGAGEAASISACYATPDYFSVLRAQPALGRTFSSDEDRPGRDHVVVLSHRLWQANFGGTAAAIGKTFKLNGEIYTVIGVMPAALTFPAGVDLWVSTAVQIQDHNSMLLSVIGRLKDGASLSPVAAELDTMVKRMPAKIFGEEGSRRPPARVIPLLEFVSGKAQRALLIFLGAVAFVLLIACTNVANLMLARAAARRQEIAVRSALGAGRGRLLRPLLAESMLIALGGGIAGLLLALWGVPALTALAPGDMLPRVEQIGIDKWVLVFTLVLSMATGLGFGILPALQVTRAEVRESLSLGGRTATGRHETLRSALVVSEIALALVLLTGAGLMLRSFLRLTSSQTGFQPENTIAMMVDLPDNIYKTTPQMQAFRQQTVERITHLPGVTAAGAVNWVPLGGALIMGDFHLEDGRPLPHDYMVDKPAVTPGYFRAMRIPILRGRDFSEPDNAQAPGTVIVSDSVARRFWPREDPIGKRIAMVDDPQPKDWLTIVGVAQDVKQTGMSDKQRDTIYQALPQITQPFFLSHMAFVARTAGDPRGLAAAVRAVVRGIDKDQPVQRVAMMQDLIAESTAEPRFQARLLGAFSLLALILAAVGIYGVLAYSVTQRTHEIGIRMALGAERRNVLSLVLRRTLALAGAGLVIGTAGALAATRVLARFLYEIKPTDPATFVTVAALLTVVALLAGLIPARRATKVDPMVALRYE